MTSLGEPLEINSHELVRILRENATSAGCVLLDCRPFLDFSLAHISESRNVNWNSVLRRRSKSTEVALEWLIPDKALLGRLRRGDFSLVVVVDDGSSSVAKMRVESVGQMLLTALQNEVHTQICFLQGGFEGFSEAYPELCYSKQLSAGEPETVSSGRSTPAYDQCRPLVTQRDPHSSGHHSCPQRLLMFELLRGGVPIPSAQRGGQSSCRHRSLLLHSYRLYRFSEAERGSGARALPSRYLSLGHHLSGLPHARPAGSAGRGLRLREAAASRHLAQPGLHGTVAAV
ncbi:dual specificity protein phosphatase 2 isoform X2 [Dunckerocampus dactyliophorus]|uniref:dual specificity protein phosphatase 2 isoform X2 n=1 Tax=Dunckerocampus dactyliophorus TaxID=161453 RepID=UPI002406E74F|nr:dual specificity protein phosphatase 2 isoform X2 [Dunckerocampus dactyliophorus]